MDILYEKEEHHRHLYHVSKIQPGWGKGVDGKNIEFLFTFDIIQFVIVGRLKFEKEMTA